MRLSVDVDDRAFGAAFGQISQVVVRGLARPRQIFECGFDGVVVAATKPVVDQLDQAALPELFLEPAARFGQTARKFDQTLCVDGLSAARANASAAHERTLRSGNGRLSHRPASSFLSHLRLMRGVRSGANGRADDAWLRYPINASTSSGPLDSIGAFAQHTEAIATIGEKIVDGHTIGLSEIDRTAIELH